MTCTWCYPEYTVLDISNQVFCALVIKNKWGIIPHSTIYFLIMAFIWNSCIAVHENFHLQDIDLVSNVTENDDLEKSYIFAAF